MSRKPQRSGTSEPVALGLGWSVVLERRSRGAVLRVQHPEQAPVAIEIAITASGPVIRAAAAALELESATDIVARCERFAVEARESASIRAQTIEQQATGELSLSGSSVGVDARLGGVVVHANDDVQLLGEQVLLNCDRDPPVPSWIPQAAAAPASLPREDSAGDRELLDE
jgi:hypothetical protein